MKQLLQYMRDGKTIVADIPQPALKPGFVLVRNAASLVSAGTERMLVEFAEKNLLEKAQARPDLVRQVLDKARREGLFSTIEAAFNRLDAPMALGYSSAGTIIAVGPGVEGFQPGDRVACAGGGFAVHAEVASVPVNLLAHLPDNVDFESGAFTTLAAIALQGFRLAQPQIGERVAVIGLGLLGLLSVEIALAAGCSVFGVDIDPERVKLAEKLGAKASLRPQAEAAGVAISAGKGFDIVLICADAKTADPVELAGVLARDRARVSAVGVADLHLPRKIYYEKELEFLVSRSYGPGRYDPKYEEGGQDYPIGYVRWTEGRNLAAICELLGSGRMDVHPLISHSYPIEQAPQAYDLILGKLKEPFLGVLLTYPYETALPTNALVANPNAPLIPPGGAAPGIAVLGSGNYASAVFLPAIDKVGGSRKVVIVSGSGLTAQHAASKHGYSYASTDENEAIADPQVQAVVLLTRHNLHARQTLAALRLGKAVYCEKPLAIHPAELEEIAVELNKQPGALLMVGFNRRFAPLAVKMKAFLAECSEPMAIHYTVNAGFLPANHWLHNPEIGGGRIVGEGCHFIDFLTFLTGALPTRVSAQALPDNGRYHQDNVILTFSYPNGSIGTLAYLANGDKSYPKERVEVFCGGNVAVLNDFRRLEWVKNNRFTVVNTPLSQDKGHRSSWQAFLKTVQSGGQPPIPYDQLLGVTQASFTALEALRLGCEQAIVPLDISPLV